MNINFNCLNFNKLFILQFIMILKVSKLIENNDLGLKKIEKQNLMYKYIYIDLNV